MLRQACADCLQSSRRQSFAAARPALLYLVPACLGSALGTAAVRGELSDLFAFTDPEEPAAEEAPRAVENEAEVKKEV